MPAGTSACSDCAGRRAVAAARRTTTEDGGDVTYLLRVVLPDRPGTLGAVASALGGEGADILSVDVVERHQGVAVDDLVVDLPAARPRTC